MCEKKQTVILGNLTKALLFQTGNKVDLGYSPGAICTNSLHVFVLCLCRGRLLCALFVCQSVLSFKNLAEMTHFEAGRREQAPS